MTFHAKAIQRLAQARCNVSGPFACNFDEEGTYTIVPFISKRTINSRSHSFTLQLYIYAPTTDRCVRGIMFSGRPSVCHDVCFRASLHLSVRPGEPPEKFVSTIS